MVGDIKEREKSTGREGWREEEGGKKDCNGRKQRRVQMDVHRSQRCPMT